MLREMRQGQTMVEYVVLLIIVIGSFIGIQNYMKRGLQGRWRDAVDSLGDQYDPRTASTSLLQSIYSNTNTQITALNTAGGYWTSRVDNSLTIERKAGMTTMGAY